MKRDAMPPTAAEAPVAEAQADQAVPVTVYCTAPEHQGVFRLAEFSAPELDLPEAFLMLDMPGNRLVMTAKCGCHVHFNLSAILHRLGSVAGSCGAGQGVH
jgi:hypothetical protein